MDVKSAQLKMKVRVSISVHLLLHKTVRKENGKCVWSAVDGTVYCTTDN